MADVRALLAAERQSRRISHPFLTYSKSGQLLCNICNLNVKSESLWEGHLRSANHRKNAAKAAEDKSPKNLKRKLDESDEDNPPPEDDPRKKPKSRAPSHVENLVPNTAKTLQQADTRHVQKTVRFDLHDPPPEDPELPTREPPPKDDPVSHKEQPQPTEHDDEMAAFEREIASLDKQPDYSAATITAAPVSAAELEQQEKEDKRKQLELDAEDEIEEEGRKMEEEFEAMEELEERINKLKERREALRKGGDDPSALEPTKSQPMPSVSSPERQEDESQDEDEDEDGVDDWYT